MHGQSRPASGVVGEIDSRSGGLLEPGDDPGALGGVRRRDLLTDEGVEERRLPGLHCAGEGDAERLLESGGAVPEFLDGGGVATQFVPGGVDQLAGL